MKFNNKENRKMKIISLASHIITASTYVMATTTEMLDNKIASMELEYWTTDSEFLFKGTLTSKVEVYVGIGQIWVITNKYEGIEALGESNIATFMEDK